MKKIISTMLAVMMLISSSAYAKTVKTIVSDSTDVTYKGVADASETEREIVFWVLNKGVEWSDKLDYSEILYFNTANLAEDETEYEFDFTITENGQYRVVKNYDKDSLELAEYIGYTKKSDFDSAIDALALCADATAVKDYLEKNKVNLAMYDDLFTVVTEAEAASIVKASIDSDSEFADLMGAYVAQALNQGEDIELNNYIEYVADSTLAKHYDTDNSSEYVTSLSDYDFINYDDFYKVLKETVILTNVRVSDGATDITNMLNDYAKDIGIERTVTDEISRSVMGNSYTLPTLATAVNEYVSTGGGGGGGGGGGASAPSKKDDPLFDDAISVTPGSPLDPNPSVNDNNMNTSLFADTASVPWAEAAISTLFKKGVVTGKESNLFYPLDNVKREECVAMLMRAFQFNITGATPTFTDMVKGEWYEDVIKSAYNAGVVSGESDEIFGIGKNVTRQDMAVMIYNALTVAEIDIPTTADKVNYIDSANIADYAEAAVSYLQQRGIIQGYDDNSFGPRRTANRAELSVMIYRILPYLELGK